MKKTYLVTLSALMLGVIMLSGCGNGVPKEDFTKVQNDLTEAQNRIVALETQLTEAESRIAYIESRVVAFSAYHIWFDQYYGFGIYTVADTDTFITEFGGAIDFIPDSDLQSAWNDYLATDTALGDYLAEVPSDSATWTDSQSEKYQELASDVYNALGAVGQALLSTIWNL